MLSNQENFSYAGKEFLESQFAHFNALASKGLEGGEKLIALNIAAVKASAEEFNDTARQLLTLKDPQAIFAFVADKTKPNAEKAVSYGRHLAEITSGIQADLTKAVEAQIAGTTNKVTALVEQVAKSTPAGSEQAVAMLKSVMGNANAGYQKLAQTSRHAAEKIDVHAAKTIDQVSRIKDEPASE